MSLPTFSSSTTAEEVASAFADEIRGKNILVTGTSLNGLGFEVARVFAKYANLVVVTGHNSERLKLAEEAIKAEVPSANIRPLMLDLSSLASIRKAAAEVNAYTESLHVVIHNAAAPMLPFTLTADNLETQVTVSHIGPFLLTKLLAPKILASRTADYTPRVVFVSSIGHSLGKGVNFDTLGSPDSDKYNTMDAYFQAKAASVIDAIELSKRSQGQINAYSLHPGAIYTTIIEKSEPDAMKTIGLLDAEGKRNSAVQWKTLGQGAATILVAAVDSRLNNVPGAYIVDCVPSVASAFCTDPKNGERLWALTEKIVGETFAF
ncbi:hypothetical protein C8R46DRAFT_87838 [Mycena filopes]|nr:hypothetical protein C8R46DRAFT_87838 [Mycena filopes]